LLCCYDFSFPQALASGADRVKRGLLGAKSQQDFAPGAWGKCSPNKLQLTHKIKCKFDFVRTVALLARIAKTHEKSIFGNGYAVAF